MQLFVCCIVVIAIQGSMARFDVSLIRNALGYAQSKSDTHENVSGCGELASIFLEIRDDVFTVLRWLLQDEFDVILDDWEESTAWDLDSNEFWYTLACDINGIESLEDATVVINNYNNDKKAITQEEVANYFLWVRRYKVRVVPVIEAYRDALMEVIDFARKTNFPNDWPLPNTNVMEVAQLLTTIRDLPTSVTPRRPITDDDMETINRKANEIIGFQSFDAFYRRSGFSFFFGNDDEGRRWIQTALGHIQTVGFEQMANRMANNLIELLNQLEQLGVLDL